MLNPIRNTPVAYMELSMSLATLIIFAVVGLAVLAWKKFIPCMKESVIWPIIRHFLG